MRNKQILLLALRTIKIKIENYRILNKNETRKSLIRLIRCPQRLKRAGGIITHIVTR